MRKQLGLIAAGWVLSCCLLLVGCGDGPHGSGTDGGSPPDGAGGTPDAPAVCGDGVVTLPETCDTAIASMLPGACPGSCLGDACTTGTLEGSECTAQCRWETIETCADDDGCCPAGCDRNNDSDCGRCTPGAWSAEDVVTAAHEVGSGIGVDASGRVHIAYVDHRNSTSRLRVADRGPGETAWTLSTAWQSSGHIIESFDFVVTPDGGRHASYYQTPERDPFLATQPAGQSWNGHLQVDPDWDAGSHNAVAADSSGNVYVMYYNQVTDNFNRTRGWPTSHQWSGAQWDVLLGVMYTGSLGIEDRVGQYMAGVAGTTRVHAVYYHGPEHSLYYASTPLGQRSWGAARIELWSVGPADIAVDSSQHPHVVGASGGVFTHFEGPSWAKEQPDTVRSWAPVIAIDRWDHVHVAYLREGASNEAWYAKRVGTTWTLERIDTAGNVADASLSIAVDDSGAAHVAYVDLGENPNDTDNILRYLVGCR